MERRQVVDVPITRLHVTEHQAQEKQCPHGFKLSRASFPSGIKAPIQSGTSIGALAVYLVEYQVLPFARACEVVSDVLGVSRSEGTIRSLIEQTHQQLEDVESQLKTALIQAQVIHQDETSIYVGGKPNWVHVCSSKMLTHYGFHGKRGQEAMDALGIAPPFHGTSVHDGRLSYQKYSCTHAACNVHYLRDLTFVEEEYQQPWARKMKDLLLGSKRLVEDQREAGALSLSPQGQARIRFQYDPLVTAGYLNNPAAKRQPRGPGRNREHPARKLLHRLLNYRDQILRFMEDFAVPFDNNQAERDLRMIKVQQKISGGFRQQSGVTMFCRIRSSLSTLRKQGQPLLQALEPSPSACFLAPF
jgi:transposase